MVTRNIKKNTATQVNANLIGVQVRPTVVPPTYEVDSLVANVRVKRFHCDNTMNGLPMLYVNSGSGDEIWGYTGNQEEYNGTVYNVWSCIKGSTQYNMYTNVNDEIVDQTQFYVVLDEPGHPVMPAPPSKYKLSYSGVLSIFYPSSIDYYVMDSQFVETYLDGTPECSLVDGFFYSVSGKYLGMYVSDELYVYEGVHCFYLEQDSLDERYSVWEPDFGFAVTLYSDTRNPDVGYNLISNIYDDQGEEVYLSPVTSVHQEEVDPGSVDPIDCTLSYSVDGSTWTDWPENMTDANNVISNIPRYMYLKFSQDVVITEE